MIIYRGVSFEISSNPNFVNSDVFETYIGACFSRSESGYSEIFKDINKMHNYKKSTLEIKDGKYLLSITV